MIQIDFYEKCTDEQWDHLVIAVRNIMRDSNIPRLPELVSLSRMISEIEAGTSTQWWIDWGKVPEEYKYQTVDPDGSIYAATMPQKPYINDLWNQEFNFWDTVPEYLNKTGDKTIFLGYVWSMRNRNWQTMLVERDA